MRTLIAIIVALLAGTASAHATSYTAICNDGQRVQLNVSPTGAASLYMRTLQGQMHLVAAMKTVYTAATYVCVAATGPGNPEPAGNALCINFGEHPQAANPAITIGALVGTGATAKYNWHGDYCKANVTVKK